MSIFFWPLAFGVIIIVSASSINSGTHTQTTQSSAQVEVLGGQFLAYRAAVVAYARANPSATGTVADGALQLPDWLAKPQEFRAYVQTGESFSYFLPPTPRPSIADLGLYPDGGIVSSVGVAVNGRLVSGTSAAAGRALPIGIPDGAIVYVN
ncbi:type IV pilus biogenesis protein PilM [Bordetella pseudohinzii]|uniref:type IV pilus biogenesis protein PilM n=1 Tax=Bordetella pseudohinzii TaxID=1331258 RepID=UPI0013F4D056|nr:type IV pilus biogenesis protein PilM [Bordetella pseudohinzii]